VVSNTGSIPYRVVLSFTRKSWGSWGDSLNSETLIIPCNLWRRDNKSPDSDGSTKQTTINCFSITFTLLRMGGREIPLDVTSPKGDNLASFSEYA
jgi:hypothetical protein